MDAIARIDHVHPTDTSRIATADIDTDSTFAANSDSKLPSQKAVKTAVTGITPAIGQIAYPSFLYDSSDAKKQIRIANGMHDQNSPANGDYYIIPVFCAGGETILDINIYKSNARGIFDIYISNNGTTYNLDSSGYDGYASSATPVYLSVTLTRTITQGWNYIKLVVNGKNASSSNYYLSTYGVRLR